jgi:hypothetical protein
MRWHADMTPRLLHYRFLAIKYIEPLTTNHREIHELWEWGRRENARAFAQLLRDVPALRAENANIGWLYSRELDLQWFFENACALHLQILGYGVDAQLTGSVAPEMLAIIPDVRRWLR